MHRGVNSIGIGKKNLYEILGGMKFRRYIAILPKQNWTPKKNNQQKYILKIKHLRAPFSFPKTNQKQTLITDTSYITFLFEKHGNQKTFVSYRSKSATFSDGNTRNLSVNLCESKRRLETRNGENLFLKRHGTQPSLGILADRRSVDEQGVSNHLRNAKYLDSIIILSR